MKKVLVTGITGMVGRAVFTYLAQTAAYRLIGTVRSSYSQQIAYKNVVFAKFDLTREADVFHLCEQFGSVDAVVHIAAALTQNPYVLLSSNYFGTLNCVKLAWALRAKRFIYISSIQVIGRPQSLPITEDHTINPQTLYHLSKLFGEYILFMEHNRRLNPVILRIPSPIGPGIRPNGIVSTFLQHSLDNHDIILYGKGLREQNYTDTRDIALAVDLALRSTGIGVYNIASLQAISNLELAKLCKKICHSDSKIVFNGKEDPEESFLWRISIDKAIRELGFIPRFSLEESLQYLILNNTKTKLL